MLIGEHQTLMCIVECFCYVHRRMLLLHIHLLPASASQPTTLPLQWHRWGFGTILQTPATETEVAGVIYSAAEDMCD